MKLNNFYMEKRINIQIINVIRCYEWYYKANIDDYLWEIIDNSTEYLRKK